MDNTSPQLLDINSNRNNITLPLSKHIEHSVRDYFKELEGELPQDLYPLLLQELEKPLLNVVLEVTEGNQTIAAKVLGLSRGTLRKKMAIYGLM